MSRCSHKNDWGDESSVGWVAKIQVSPERIINQPSFISYIHLYTHIVDARIPIFWWLNRIESFFDG